MAKLLLLETATSVCSVGFAEDDNFLLEKLASKPMSHTEELTLSIQDGLSDLKWNMVDLDAVILSQGPGSYTALRVGAATAKGICFSLNIPLIAVDTLQALAWGIHQRVDKHHLESAVIFPMIDARRMEVYGAKYSFPFKTVTAPEAIILNQEFLESQIPPKGRLYIGGSGAAKAKELSTSNEIQLFDIECSARHLLEHGLSALNRSNYEDVAYFKPQYLKPPNITTPKPIWK